MSTNRIDKINSLLERELSKIIQRDVSFFNNVLVTLTYVKASANLIEAKVYISVFPEEKAPEVLEILKKEVYSIQQKVNRKLNMRPIPKIIFLIDKKEAEAGKIEELLGSLKKEEK
jgi:ribosome-binding factor A